MQQIKFVMEDPKLLQRIICMGFVHAQQGLHIRRRALGWTEGLLLGGRLFSTASSVLGLSLSFDVIYRREAGMRDPCWMQGLPS